MSKIIVVGSSNTDMVVKTPRFPQPGETILGGDFFMFPGGKGANQAVAASRLKGNVDFVCCVGDDIFGKKALEGYQKEGLDISGAKRLSGEATGVALITVNGQGENEIVVASGANLKLSVAQLKEHLKSIEQKSIFLTQLETPLEVVEYLVSYCGENQQKLVINPAPAQELSPKIFNGLFLITPNETETKILTGIEVTDEESAIRAGKVFFEKGVENVIITMGKKGAFFMNKEEHFLTPGIEVKAADTTAAGDVFNGALVVCLSQGKNWPDSIAFANKAAALSVTKMGAQDSAPYLNEIS
ncbi:ribokinase [Eudoraea chungangensis]|uniref:ribokinase n=1 Tax=Eudoraea chungangensis TaxID=1481905 RepID=UPI0023EB572A|nr:ribokinase [Eudoraea chungangensis]